MFTPANSGNWKGVAQNRLGDTGSNSYAPSKSGSNLAKTGPRSSLPKKKDDSPPVTPDSTCEPPPRPARQFQEGDDVFFHTDDGQHVLGTVGQIVGQTCQVLFGDGTQQWASFKRIKKLTATLEDEEDNAHTVHESEQKRQPKEETIEMFCTVCGAKKKIPASKAKTFKPEGPNEFKCRKCNKLPEPTPHRSLSSFLKLPQLKGQAASVISNTTTSLLQNVKNGITIPTASGSLSIFRQTPAPASQGTAGNANAKNTSTIVKSPRTLQQIAGPSRLKSNSCFNCEAETEPLDRIPCNLCGRFCHLSCLPLNSPPPPKGDRFWDLMCSSCGTQNNDGNSRSRVFSVRRNISSWSDVADLILSCIAVGKPSQQFFDLDTEILPFLEGNMNNLKLPRYYTLPTPEDRKKFIIHALFTSRLRFINGKEVKKRATLWALRVDMTENRVKQELQSPVKTGDKEKTSSHQFPRNVTFAPISPDKSGQTKSSRKQSKPVRHITAKFEPVEENRKKTVSLPFGMVPSPTLSAGSGGQGLNNASICNLANFVQIQAASALANQHGEGRKSSSHELTRKQVKRLHSASLRTTPDRVEVPAIKKIKLSPTSNSLSKSKSPPHSGSQARNVSLSPVKKTPVALPNLMKNQSLQQLPSTGEVKKKQIVTVLDKDKPKAIKSSSILPALPQQVKAALKVEEEAGESSEESPKKKEKGDKPVKPKLRNLQLKASILKRAAATKVKRLKIPNREEPLKIKKALGRRRNDETKNGNVVTRESKVLPLRLATATGRTASKQAGGQQDKDWLPSRLSKRILEMKHSVVSTGDILADLLARNSSTLMDAILYGGYSMQCLPVPPKSEAEQRAENLKVYGHYRTEKQNETASILLGRTENETRTQTRRKLEMFGGQTRDLNDFDSYDVVARKVDEFGLTHYFVIWKGSGDESDSEIGREEELLDFDAVNEMDEEVPVPEVKAEFLVEETEETSQQVVLPIMQEGIDVT